MENQINPTMDSDKMDNSSHSHSLTSEYIQMPYYCSGCKEIGFGPCYKCKSDQCNFYLHIECNVTDASLVSHPFSKSCEFTFLNEGSQYGSSCDACGRKVKGFRYKCSCMFIKRSLHPRCTIYKDKYEINGWTLNLSKNITSICLHCEEKEEVKGWAYVSSCGDYCFHVACLWERLYDDWSNGSFSGLTDVSEMISISMVKLLSKQVQVQRRKKTSSTGKVSTGDAINIATTVVSVASGI